MDKEPRKATDVLLDIESRIDNLTSIIRSQDLLIKLMSNKLNNILDKLDNNQVKPKFSIEASTEPSKVIEIAPDLNLQIENSPVGFRRNSRPETYSGDNNYLPKLDQLKAKEEIKFPIQIPRESGKNEIVTKKQLQKAVAPSATPPMPEPDEVNFVDAGNSVPVSQRVVDANGKSAFLADVEIIDKSNMTQMFKTRTNGTGKWSAPLPVGDYKVIIKKRESLTKEKLEAVQDIRIDGKTSPFDLPMLIIRK